MDLTLKLCIFVILVSIQIGDADSVCTNCEPGNMICTDDGCRCVDRNSNGECILCRDLRFYGEECEKDCPLTCNNSRCKMINSLPTCTEGCVHGKRGENCQVSCPPACTHCERYNDTCTGPCSSSDYYGDTCETPCSQSCEDGCDRLTGECRRCKSGYTGTNCEYTCPANCKDGCHRDTGKCGRCRNGHTGDHCTIMCSSGCTDTCNVNKDTCDMCVAGYTGKNCESPCSPLCETGCDKVTGKCISCQAGYKGLYCNDTYSSHCTTCDRYSGTCLQCSVGWMGGNCSVACPHSCDGCDKNSGICASCTAGFSRTYCDGICTVCKGNANCDPKKCITVLLAPNSANNSPLLKVMLGILTVVVLVGMTFLFVKICKKRFKKRSVHKNHRVTIYQSDTSQYLDSKYWEIDDEDLESDPFAAAATPPRHSKECPSVSCNEISVKAKTECGDHLKKDYRVVREQYSNADIVIDNHLYPSCAVAVKCASRVKSLPTLTTSLIQKDEWQFQMQDYKQTPPEEQTDKTENMKSVRPDVFELNKKSKSMIALESKTDFSNIYVKYITPDGVRDGNQ